MCTSICGVAGGLAYVLGNSETAAEVVREIGSLDAEFISKVLGVYAVGAGLASAVTTPYYALKAGYEGIFGCDRQNFTFLQVKDR